MTRALVVLLSLCALECGRVEARHRTIPVALEPHCEILRIVHPDPRRRIRVVNLCYPLDTLFVPN